MSAAIASPQEKTQATASPQDPLTGMNKLQKLAAFLVLLGPEVAVNVLSQFGEKEVEEITAEIARTSFVPLSAQKALIKEFSGITLEAVTCAEGGPHVARAVLEKSLGNYRAVEVMSRLSPQRSPLLEESILREIPPRQLANLLNHERSQTCALVLSNLDTERCADVFRLLDAGKRPEVAERIATMEPVSSEVLQEIGAHLQGRLTAREPAQITHSGGTRILADILNTLDDDSSREVLAGLEGRNPDLSRSVKKLLFRFEEILTLDRAAIGKVLREIDSQMLSMALKTASEELRNHIAGAMSKRAAESLHEEIRFMAPVRVKEVEQARDQIIDVIRRLEANGEIALKRKGGGDNALV